MSDFTLILVPGAVGDSFRLRLGDSPGPSPGATVYADCAAVWQHVNEPTVVYADCAAVWGPAPVVAADCAAVWQDAPLVYADCAAVWQSGVPVWADCAAVWAHQGPVAADCAAVWRHAAGPVYVDCAAVWEHVDAPPAPPDPPAPAPPEDGALVTLGGIAVDPVRIAVTWSRQQSVIEVEVELPDEQYYATRRHSTGRVALWGYAFDLVVDGRARNERFGGHTWTIRLASPAATLEQPWADPVEGELTGQASDLARRLAGSLALDWRAVDWRIGPGRWIASGEGPLALLQALAGAVGAAVTSTPAGGLVVAPLYPVSPQDWASAEPAAILTATGEVITLATGDDRREGINAITVSDAGTSTNTLRIEEDSDRKRGATTEVLVYQTPWQDNFDVTHRGNPAFAGLEPMGQEERLIEDEEIIVTDGRGRAQYPVYGIVAARYNWVNLGTPTYSEDGEITTAVQDESILLLSYRTRCRRYRAREVNLTDLLVVAEDEA